MSRKQDGGEGRKIAMIKFVRVACVARIAAKMVAYAHGATGHMAERVKEGNTLVRDVYLSSYFDTIPHAKTPVGVDEEAYCLRQRAESDSVVAESVREKAQLREGEDQRNAAGWRYIPTADSNSLTPTTAK